MQRPQARTSSRGKGPAEKGPGGAMREPTGLAPGSQYRAGPSIQFWLVRSQSEPLWLHLLPLDEPGQAAFLLSAFALGCLIPVWALGAPRVGAGPTMGPRLLLRCEAATATSCLLAGTEGAPRGRWAERWRTESEGDAETQRIEEDRHRRRRREGETGLVGRGTRPQRAWETRAI